MRGWGGGLSTHWVGGEGGVSGGHFSADCRRTEGTGQDREGGRDRGGGQARKTRHFRRWVRVRPGRATGGLTKK